MKVKIVKIDKIDKLDKFLQLPEKLSYFKACKLQKYSPVMKVGIS
jgi:hypothetical protein